MLYHITQFCILKLGVHFSFTPFEISYGLLEKTQISNITEEVFLHFTVAQTPRTNLKESFRAT
jgi:hypothetical protein